jgi:hypothetical protein
LCTILLFSIKSGSNQDADNGFDHSAGKATGTGDTDALTTDYDHGFHGLKRILARITTGRSMLIIAFIFKPIWKTKQPLTV